MESARQQAVKDLCKNPKWDYVEKSTFDKLIEFMSAGEDSSLEEVEKTALIVQCQSLDVCMVFHAVKTKNIDPEPLAGTPIYERLKLMSSSGPKHMRVISKDIKISLNAMAEGKFEKKGELSTSEKVQEAMEKVQQFPDKVVEHTTAYQNLMYDAVNELHSEASKLMSASGPEQIRNAMAEGKFEKKGELSTSEKVREALEKRDRFVEKVCENINAYYELRDDTEKEIQGAN